MTKAEVIGRVKGHDVIWNSRTGEILVRKPGFLSSSYKKLDRRGTTIPAVFAIVEDYLRKR